MILLIGVAVRVEFFYLKNKKSQAESTQWIHVAILTMPGVECFVIMFGQVVVIVALEGTRDGLIRFMRS